MRPLVTSALIGLALFIGALGCGGESAPEEAQQFADCLGEAGVDASASSGSDYGSIGSVSVPGGTVYVFDSAESAVSAETSIGGEADRVDGSFTVIEVPDDPTYDGFPDLESGECALNG
jgi:hypothetical protein